MLRVSNAHISYARVPAVQGASFDLDSGKIVALVGANGAGKSTLLRAIAGLNSLDSGEIHFDGKRIDGLPAHERVRLGISLVPEGRHLFSRLTVQRNLELGGYTRADSCLDDVLDIFPFLKERRAQLAGTLSGGEQQMLAIARGLMSRPKLLMLDEPSWGVAPILVTRIFETVKRINESGVAVLLVEQNVRRALKVASHAYVVQTGRIVLHGPSAELLGSELVQRAYLGI
jgi:branched-chain amino acid transport system ATP-binding protein